MTLLTTHRRRRARIEVRLARVEDSTSVAALFDAYRQFYEAASDVDAARDFLSSRLGRDESVVFIALAATTVGERPGEDLAGFAQLYRSFSSLSLGPILILNDLFVAPAWRRVGVARRLAVEVAAYAEGAGAIRLELATQRTNLPALALYRSLGFVSDNQFTHMSLELAGRRGTRQ